MKNLIIRIDLNKRFSGEPEILTKIQIDNSLVLGWKKEDIILATNFDYEYQGVKALVVGDENFCSFRSLSSKTITVAYLLEKGLIEDDIYWVHDHDAYQNVPFELDFPEDCAFTDYGWSPKWCLGSYFFKRSAKDMFQWIKKAIYDFKLEDERAFRNLTDINYNNINSRYRKINITYNFGMREVEFNYKQADKPLRVVHFHPNHRDNRMSDTTLNIFMYGKNGMGIPLMSEGLIKIFNKYGYK